MWRRSQRELQSWTVPGVGEALPASCLLSGQSLPLCCLPQGLPEVGEGAWVWQEQVLRAPLKCCLCEAPFAVLCSRRCSVGSGQPLVLPRSTP